LLVPPLDDQRAIAHILGTLDDKIELNRRMNATLEATARAIFKSWFVDFDPVRANAAGRAPVGMTPEVAALFPDGFEDSELGEIPRGWRLSTLDAISRLNPEAWSKATRPDKIAYLDLSNTKWGVIEAVTEYSSADAPSRAQRILRPGDTIIGTVRPGNGSFAYINQEGLTGSTGFAVLRPLKTEYADFVYLAATEPGNIERLSLLADGGAYPAVRPEAVLDTAITFSTKEILEHFSGQVVPLFALFAENEKQSRTLATLRDALLPKLLSGEIRVGAAEREIAEVL
jgi:type I restriction enzyme S subunit